jgi:CCR4-NOT transcriptional regulation complex NOT5 subunit
MVEKRKIPADIDKSLVRVKELLSVLNQIEKKSNTANETDSEKETCQNDIKREITKLKR